MRVGDVGAAVCVAVDGAAGAPGASVARSARHGAALEPWAVIHAPVGPAPTAGRTWHAAGRNVEHVGGGVAAAAVDGVGGTAIRPATEVVDAVVHRGLRAAVHGVIGTASVPRGCAATVCCTHVAATVSI